jgi:hypothetical protein
MKEMKISTFSNLISYFPVFYQAFWSKRDTWETSLKIKKLPGELEAIFGDEKWVFISRGDIFNETKKTPLNIERVLFMTILWGYPAGLRSDYFPSLLKYKDYIIRLLEIAQEEGGVKDWDSHFSIVRKIRGVGLSLYSKLLYFLKIKVENYDPLILDLRIMDVFENEVFEDFRQLSNIRYHNAPKNYVKYLKAMKSVAEKLNIEADNLEMFLYLFGGNLKHTECEQGHAH